MESNTKSKNEPDANVENAATDFDPFAGRQNANPTTNNETLVHLLKSSLGTGILAMPYAFKLTGLALGILMALITTFITTHCSYILVQSSHILYKRTKRTQMTFGEVAESAFQNGPRCLHFLSTFARHYVTICLFVSYFGSCSVYTVILGTNAKQMYEHYTGEEDVNLRLCVCCFVIPLTLLAYIPNLKYMAPFSMLANICMGAGLLCTGCYLINGLPPVKEPELFHSFSEIPTFVSITIFALEAIGIIMPLENQMKTPQNFVGICGVMSRGMTFVTLVYVLLGAFGYWCYGGDTHENITINLPTEQILAQMIKFSIAIAVFFSFSLQIYVCIDLVWEGMKHRFAKKSLVMNYVIRTAVASGSALLAVALPTISPLIAVIGAFCFSTLGLLAPILIELASRYGLGYGRFNWILWKNIILIAFSLFVLFFGSKNAIEDIIEELSGTSSKVILH